MDYVSPISFFVIYFILINRVRFFSFYGTIGRGQYFLIYILYFVIFYFLFATTLNETFFFTDNYTLPFVVSFFIFGRLLRLPIDVRRFHDIGFSGWYSLLLFLPIINTIVVLVLFFKDYKASRYSQPIIIDMSVENDTEHDLRSEIKLIDLSILVLVSFITMICFRFMRATYMSYGNEEISAMYLMILSAQHLDLFRVGLMTILATLLSFICYSKIKVKNLHISILITCFIFSILSYFLIDLPALNFPYLPSRGLLFFGGCFLIPALLGVYGTKVYKNYF